MAESPFRFRNIQVHVDMTEAAELDVQLYGISEQSLDLMGHALKSLPQSRSDRSVANFLIREIDGFDVVYIVGRDGRDVVITIGRIRPPDPQDPTEAILKGLDLVAIFRGVTGA
jgi:hypothetical protein